MISQWLVLFLNSGHLGRMCKELHGPMHLFKPWVNLIYGIEKELEGDIRGQTDYVKWRFSKAQGNLETLSACGELYIKSPDICQNEMLTR